MIVAPKKKAPQAPHPKLTVVKEPLSWEMPEHPDRQAELVAVAIGVSRGLKDAAISRTMRLRRAKVAKLRVQAVRLGLVTLDTSKISNPLVLDKALQLIDHSDAFEQLKQLPGGKRLKFYKCLVSGSLAGDERLSEDEFRARLRVFAVEAAPHLMHALTNAEVTLVTYGRTVEHTFKAACCRSLAAKFEAYPACCAPFEYCQAPWSSSELAKWITQQQGRSKAKCFLNLVKRGLVNIAIVDNCLEAELRKLLDGELKKAT